jgi:hypothetical protein
MGDPLLAAQADEDQREHARGQDGGEDHRGHRQRRIDRAVDDCASRIVAQSAAMIATAPIWSA